jgi:hypothetical protein
VAAALRVAWEATDGICGKRLAPFLPELVPHLERHGRGSTRPTSALQKLIPVRSYAQKWQSRLGEIEVDLVAHGGRSTEGFYLYTLVAVELTTGWTECVPLWGKGQSHVGYERYTSHAAQQQLDKLYELLREQMNFFQPLRKLIPGERVDGKVHKRYDVAQTPYQRLLRQGVEDEGKRLRLAERYQSLNPVKLRAQIDEALRLLWQMAKPDPRTEREMAAWTATEAAQTKAMHTATRTHGNIPSEASLPLR